ncbi:citryl-CoA lyase [Aeromicrobium fastidiosum]|uniref:citryl-CoA lyase n=1 Tax=Aeromicrobium TaxID=2040 RepID=UPI00177C677C|nr:MULTISPECIES: citryl-CoA lyase [Aeromicrobium]MBD8605498.1 citryl-CoA lyase [Aeromicrobium sp. CFBP 8757]MCL8250415.1 citryl-CoA lyase [Aeromicrobium fastidiosum]
MSDMSWRTAIAQVNADDVIIRGHRLTDLVGSVTYADMAFLLMRGDLPSAPERNMLDAILVTLADHGISPTTIIARTLASCGTPIQASIAGASLSIADWHGGSGEEVGQILAEILERTSDGADAAVVCASLVADRKERREQVPGFGHPQHTGGDPRAIQLLGLAESYGVAGRYCETLDILGTALGESTGRENLRRANVTGALAAVLLDLGFPWRSIRGVVIAARSLGLTAHVVEELEQGNRWRHAAGDSVEYTGPLPA